MGMYSWECPACRHSIRATCATNETSHWLCEAVVVMDDGQRLIGEYDGYGGIGHGGVDGGDVFTLYHKACWHLLGKPAFTKPSRSAWDQGYFVGEYDPEVPRTKADLESLSGVGAEKREASENVWKRVLQKTA